MVPVPIYPTALTWTEFVGPDVVPAIGIISARMYANSVHMDLVVIMNAAHFAKYHVTVTMSLEIVKMAVKVDGRDLTA